MSYTTSTKLGFACCVLTTLCLVLLVSYYLSPSLLNTGSSPDCCSHHRITRIRSQRDALSSQLDSALQRLGQLQCRQSGQVSGTGAQVSGTSGQVSGVAGEVSGIAGEVSGVAGEVSGTGAWCERVSRPDSPEHLTDATLVRALSRLFENRTVASFGDGPGTYKAQVEALGGVLRYDAYDGAPWAEQVTNGCVRHLDLSVERFGLPVYDWVLSLEVAEHIPRQFEGAFLSNLARHAARGVVLSWAGPGQGGFHHVNTRPAAYVQGRMERLGFSHDLHSSRTLREQSSLGWLQTNVNVYRRTDPSTLDTDMA